jgi:ribosomal protein L17
LEIGKQNDHKFCEFCRDIAEFAEILFQVGSIYVTQPQSKELK